MNEYNREYLGEAPIEDEMREKHLKIGDQNRQQQKVACSKQPLKEIEKTKITG